MNSKSLVYLGMFVGSFIGGSVPLLWGDSMLSISSLLLGAVGGLAGIWLGFKASQW